MDFRTCQERLSSELDVFKNNNEIENLLEGLNVEDGLSANDNETFLLASLAFLQQHAKRKLGMIMEQDFEPELESKKFKTTYSNMLLFETPRGNMKQRMYLKLKDHEKFDDLLKSETCIAPMSILSQEQILPKAKNPTKLSKLFRTRSSTLTAKKSLSLFSIFRQRSNKVKNKKRCEIHAFEDGYSSEDVRSRNDWTWGMKQKCQNHSNSEEQRQKQLQFIKGLENDENNLLIKASVHRKLRANAPDSLVTVDKFLLENNSEDGEELSMDLVKNQHLNINWEYDEFSNGNRGKEIKEKRKKLSRPLSKISVCFEEDTESELETVCRRHPSTVKIGAQPVTQSESKISFSNFSDELKAHLSPQVLQTIISEMIICLEDAPSNKSLHSILNQHS